MGGGNSSSTTSIKAQLPDVFTPIAPTTTAPEALPENLDEALFTSGASRTDAENVDKRLGTSRLVIPLGDNTQSGGYTAPRTPTGVV